MKQNRLEGKRTIDKRGSALTEGALVLPVLILLCLATIDLGRVFVDAISLSDAAAAGAFYGAQDPLRAVDLSDVESRASTNGGQLNAFSATAQTFCGCPDGSQVDCRTGSCGVYGHPRMYSKVTGSSTFESITGLFGVGNVSRAARVRVR